MRPARLSARGAALAVLPAALACACGPRELPGGLAAGSLGHALPELEVVSYAFADTMRLTVGGGAIGQLDVVRTQEGEAELEYEADDEGLDVVLRLTAYSATAENPRQATARAGLGDIEGEWRLRLDPRGLATIVDRPESPPTARIQAAAEPLPHPFFVALPGAPAEPGASWVDTVRTADRAGGLETRTVAVIRHTLVGDTVVSGRRALLIRTVTTARSETEGRSGGVEVRQRLEGMLTGTALWDDRWRVMLAREEAGDLTGTLELPGSGAGPLPVVARQVRSVRLVERDG